MTRQRWRVLIADDDTDSREMYGFALSHFGFEVVEACDGDEALARAIQPPAPDVILLDLRMPGLSGFEVFDALQALDGIRHVPVIGLSGDTRHRDTALARGFVKFCAKPCPPDRVVLDVVATLLPSVTARRPPDEVIEVRAGGDGRWWDVLWRGELQSRWPSEFAARDAAVVAAERFRAQLIPGA